MKTNRPLAKATCSRSGLQPDVFLIASAILIAAIVACQSVMPPTPPPPVTAAQDVEFTLAEVQTATVTGTGLTIRLIGVAGDQRCPSGMECAISGPVSVSLSVQKDNGTPENIDLQAFTDSDGRAATGHFEGINNLATVAGYSIKLMGVTPYPTSRSKQIKSSDYRVILTVTSR
jgi:hypothetical protein